MTLTKNKVLLVDDDPVLLEGLTIVLEARGYTVVTRDTAIGTGATIRGETPEVALLDVDMPGLRGDSVLKLLEKRTDMPMPWVIFHSSLDQDELDRLVLETNASGAIQKTDLKTFVVAFEAMLKRLRARAAGTRAAE